MSTISNPETKSKRKLTVVVMANDYPHSIVSGTQEAIDEYVHKTKIELTDKATQDFNATAAARVYVRAYPFTMKRLK